MISYDKLSYQLSFLKKFEMVDHAIFPSVMLKLEKWYGYSGYG